MLKYISRKSAKLLGLKRYFTGESCTHGHIAEKYVRNCGCCECQNVEQNSPKHQFYIHRYSALKSVGFELTFEEWLKIWMDSGHWHERGRGKDRYVMARFGDKGPYKVGNVKIITLSENTTEGQLGHGCSTEHRAKLKHAALKQWAEGRGFNGPNTRRYQAR